MSASLFSSPWLRQMVCALALLPALAACDAAGDKIASKVEQASQQIMNQVTPEQEQLADTLYRALQQGDFDTVMQHADPTFKEAVQKEPNALPFLAKQLPQGEPIAAKSLRSVNIGVQSDYGKMLVVTYQYPYEVELVNFSVSFDGETVGSLNIKGLHVSKQANNAPKTSSAE